MLETITDRPKKRGNKADFDYSENVNITAPIWMLREIEKIATQTGSNRSSIIKQGLLRGLGLQRPTDQ